MKAKIALAVLVVLVVIGGLAGVKALQIRKMVAAMQAMPLPAETVSATTVHEEKWQGKLTAIGTIAAVQGVNVTAEIPGLVREITFDSGAVVKAGEVLVRLDTSSEEAQLRAMEAQLELARLNVERERKLRSENMVSQAELDTAEATVKQCQANADAIRTTIDKKTIRAPFAGRLGIRQINLGQYLEAGRAVVSLQSLTPVYVDFSLPQQDLAVLRTGMRVRLGLDAYPDRAFEGALSAINPDVDQSTRAVGLQATFDNADQLLRPGMFARVSVLLPEETNVLVIPITAVLSAPYGDSVYVIEPDTTNPKNKSGLKVRQQIVRTGEERGDFVAVEAGVKAGERIVSAGVFKLRNDMPVVENNQVSPKASEAPRPADS